MVGTDTTTSGAAVGDVAVIVIVVLRAADSVVAREVASVLVYVLLENVFVIAAEASVSPAAPMVDIIVTV